MAKPPPIPIELEITPIWKQQPNEPDIWFHRFNRWLRMIDPEQGIFKRSLRQIFLEEEFAKRTAPPPPGKAKPGKTRQSYLTLPSEWYRAAKQYRWEDRKNAFEAHNRAIEDSIWEERTKKLREARWKFSEDLFKKAETMVKMPLVQQKVSQNGPNGQTITIIEPIDWNMRDLIGFLKIASELGGEAIGNLNWAASLIENAGFVISNPMETEVAEIPDIPDEEIM